MNFFLRYLAWNAVLLGLGTAIAAKNSETLTVHFADQTSRTFLARSGVVAGILFPDGGARAKVEPISADLTRLLAITKTASTMELVELGSLDDRIRVCGAIVGNELFIFSPLFREESVSNYNLLLAKLGIEVHSPEQAIAVSEMFLALVVFRFSAPEEFVVASGKQLANKGSAWDGLSEEVIGIIQPPRASTQKDEIQVGLFTSLFERESLMRWEFRIAKSNLSGVSEKLMIPSFAVRRHLVSDNRPGSSSNGPQFLQLSSAVGNDRDCGTLSASAWAASEGPDVSRIIYYCGSKERSDRKADAIKAAAVRNFSVNARGRLIDSPELTSREFMLFVDEKTGAQFISVLILKNDSLVRVNSECLRNLVLVLQESDGPVKSASSSSNW
jgi:hypothetical protein